MKYGSVYLVGAGPGDAGLITVRGAELLRAAECVLYDSLVNPCLLELAPADAEKLCVGKRGGEPSLSQEGINEMLLEKAASCGCVVRLKGGDPFVFGRGGEEALFLAEHGVPFEVVPGVTAAVAACAYAGFPATHRGLATVLALATGHEDPDKGSAQTDWSALAKTGGTIGVYMTVKQLERAVGGLVAGGRCEGTPAALIENATLPSQRTVVGSLGTIVEKARDAEVRPPAVLVVGDVVSLRQRLNWFETRPLFGKRIVLTRPRERSAALRDRFESLGATVLEMPTIRIEPLDDFSALDEAVARLADFDWVIFTSPAGVEHVFERLRAADKDARAFARARVGAIGSGTAAVLAEWGIRADFVPTRFTTQAVVTQLGGRERLDRKRVLLPRADIATPLLREGLAALGARVCEVTAYVTREETQAAPQVLDQIAAGAVHALTFTSASTVDYFLSKCKAHGVTVPGDLPVISIGPVTTERLRDHHLTVAAQADPHNLDGLVDATLHVLSGPRDASDSQVP